MERDIQKLVPQSGNLKNFIEQFPTFAQAPNGVVKLRELVLELAVLGKLVHQDSNEEAANVLLEKIDKEKERLSKEGKIKKRKSLPEIGDEEKNFELPKGWEWSRLGTIGNIFNGNSISANVKEEKYTNIDGGLPFIATKDVSYGWYELAYNNGVSIPLDEPKFKIAHKGAVLICAEGGSAGKKCGITDLDICFGNKLFANELYGNIEPNYILSNYLSPSFFEQFRENMTGIIGGISAVKFSQLIVAVPPLEEQKRIVAKVGELMALCDQLETQQQQQANTALKANNATIQALLNVDVDQNRKEAQQTFNDNWARIGSHFNTLYGCLLPMPPGDGRKKTHLVALENLKQLRQTILQLAVVGLFGSDSIYFRNIRLGDVVKFQNGYGFKSTWYQSSGIRLARNANVSHGYLDWRQEVRISEDLGKEYERFSLSEGDILISLDRPIISTGVKIAVVRNCDLPCLLLQRVAKPIFDRKVLDSNFLEMWLHSPAYIESIDPGRSNGVPHISTRQLSNIPIKLFSLDEQKRIVAKVDELMALCDQLEDQLARAYTSAERLVETTVKRIVA